MGLSVQTVALTCFALLAVGYVVLAILGRREKLAPMVRDAWPILFTETLIVGVAAGAFWIGGWILAVALLIHAARVGYEATSVVNRRVNLINPVLGALAMAITGFVASFLPLILLCTFGVIGLITCIVVQWMKSVSSVPRQTALVDLILFPGIPLIIFTAAGLQGGYGVWILVAFLLVETFDSYALLGGKLFGKRKAFPVLSPNKTVEGLAIGAGMLMLTAAIAGALLAGLPLLVSAGVALVAGVLTIAGDLAASRLKRLSGVKDYPRILPHQGGLFDITDAWIATGAGLVTLAVFLGPA